MKKRVGFITLDFSLASWLSRSLQTCPCTHGAELREGLEDLMSGRAESLMLELERGSTRPRRRILSAAAVSSST